MRGIILENGFKHYTYMNKIAEPIRKDFISYNWLITDCECYSEPFCSNEKNYMWISGEEFLNIVDNKNIQFIWSVFSGFSKDITPAEVLSFNLPIADEYTGFWKNPINIQHPLAEIEIVPWDGTLVLLISKDDEIINNFKKSFPQSEDLELYNKK